jgi:parafibromin
MDSLLLLRQSIAAGSEPVPTTSAGVEPASGEKTELSRATHLHFTHPTPTSAPLDAPTRFRSSDNAVDLRSIYFAWLNRELAIPDYNAAATKLNDELIGKGTIHKLAFVERLDLITWLEGASEDSEYIQPLAGDKDAAGSAAAAASKGAAAPVVISARAGRGTIDPRLAQIYNGERRMGDRNSVLRGIKATVSPHPGAWIAACMKAVGTKLQPSQDFSHVRKLAAPFMAKKPAQASATSLSNNPSLALNQKAPTRRPDPIILLSPSASSLLRMSNIKPFLEEGRYVPPDNSSTASMLHMQRTMRDIDPSRQMRFILVEGPEQFKPDYWNRVVAVFTTGQAWQFKNYKWSNPTELFKHVLGVHVGWRGEEPPASIRAYGQRLVSVSVDKWRDPAAGGAGAGDTSRWRDREVVEVIWKAIEVNMRAKGWRRDAAPTAI